MNIQGALDNINQSFRDFCYDTQQATMPIVLELKDLRNNPEFFQKVCQVAFATLQLIILRYPAASSLARFSFVLTTANMHDFYCFLKQPRQWFFPVVADKIDENAVLESLTNILYQHKYLVESTEGNDKVIDDEVDDAPLVVDVDEAPLLNPVEFDQAQFDQMREIAKAYLKAQLQDMEKSNLAYRDVEEFKEVLQRRINDQNPETTQDFFNINLQDLDVPLYHTPLAEKLNNLIWAVVDIGCVGLYLQGWDLLDTAKLAENVGQYPGFQWVKNQTLETWVVVLVGAGFAVKLFEATRKLQDEALTKEERNQAHWNVITSLAESILYGAIYLNLIGQTKFNNVYLQCFAIMAKSLGLFSIVTRPPHEYFAPRVAPAA